MIAALAADPATIHQTGHVLIATDIANHYRNTGSPGRP